MSSFDGARSTQGASDEIITHPCGPCNYEGNEIEAAKFCDDCKELLCRNCADSHKKYKQFRNHKLVPVAQLPKHEATGPTPSIVICDCNQNLEVTEYCEDHSDVVCQTCASTKHRKCKTQALTKKCFGDEKEKLSSIMQKVDAMKKNIETFLQERNADLQKLVSVKETCTKEIQSFRQTLNRHLDLLEQNVLKEMEKLESRERKNIERHISSCSATQHMLQTDIQLLENAKKSSLSEYMFVAHTKVSVHLEGYGTLLQEIGQETKTPTITFERNEQLADLQKDISKFGTLTIDYNQAAESHGKLFPDLKIRTSYQVDIESSDESCFPYITGCGIMEDGSIIVCDYANKHVKRLDRSLKECLSLQTRPWDIHVSAVNKNMTIITLPHVRQVQYIEVIPRLKTGRTIQLDKICWGVHVAGEEIFITTHDGIETCSTGEVIALDFYGNIKRKIGMNQDGSYMFNCPYYLTVSPSSRKIYVSDYRSSKVWCLKSDGGVVYQYKNRNLKGPKGVCVDAEDNLLVCGADSHNVQIVTTTGRKHSKLLTAAKDGLQEPCAIAYRHSDNTFTVSCAISHKLFVYNLS